MNEWRSWQRTWLPTGFRHTADRAVLSRVYAVFIMVRFALALHTISYNFLMMMPQARSPMLVVAANVIIAAWTVYFSWHMRLPTNRNAWDHAADAGVTISIMLLTPMAMGEGTIATLAGFWMAGCVLYAAIFMSTWSGTAMALVVCLTYFLTPPASFMVRVDVAVLTLLATVATGVLVSQLRDAVAEQEKERVRSAALAERERLFRIVHDGALQVLALVEREGPSFGPRGMRLAVLARESESQLRNLLQDRDVAETAGTINVDLAAALDKYQSARITVSTMAGQVMVSRRMVDEVEAALTEMLTNVERHAGEDAQAWILLDQEFDDEVILWVRDNGVGMSPEMISRAAERGRMGIKDSIMGRISAIGGTAMLKSTPGLGTEWELRFPVESEQE